MISVVIPLYNKEKQIGNTLRTVLNQTFQDFEIVVVNDGSTDNSTAEVERFHDQRIRLVHQDNAGVSAARNRGVEESKYELIAFLDADDEWKPSYLETQYSLYKKYPECSVFACNYEFRDADGNVRPTIIRKLPFQEIDGILSNYFKVASFSHPPICSISIMVKKSALKDICGFPIGIKSGEDLLTWAKLAVKFEIAYNKTPLAIYCVEDKSKNSVNDIRKSAPVDLKTTKDNVGQELQSLLQSTTSKRTRKQLSVYISYWYKMRSVINLNLEYRYSALKCALKAITYNALNFKAYILIFMSLVLPFSLSKKFLK